MLAGCSTIANIKTDDYADIQFPKTNWADEKVFSLVPYNVEYCVIGQVVADADREHLQKKLVTGEYLPQAAVGVQSLYLDILDTKKNHLVTFATVSLPLSGWWGGAYKIKEYNYKIDQAQNNFDEKSELLLIQIDKTYKELKTNYKQVLTAKQSVEQANEHLKIIRDNYDAGIISTSDLLEAQALHQQSLSELTDAQTAFKISKAVYLQATGNLK